MTRHAGGRRRARDERGQVTVMIIGFMLVLLMTVAVVTDASAAYLRRTGLDTVADGAALAAAQALDEPQAYQQGIGSRPALDAATATAQVQAYLRETGAYGRFPGLHVGARVDGNQVFVSVTAPLDLPLRIPGSPGRVSIRSTGSALLQPAT